MTLKELTDSLKIEIDNFCATCLRIESCGFDWYSKERFDFIKNQRIILDEKLNSIQYNIAVIKNKSRELEDLEK